MNSAPGNNQPPKPPNNQPPKPPNHEPPKPPNNQPPKPPNHEPPNHQQPQEPPPGGKKNKGRIMGWIIGLFLIIAILIFLYWFFWGRYSVETEDAYVHGNRVNLTPQISGFVSGVHVNDTQVVEEGQLLIDLDRSDMRIAFEMSLSKLAETVRNVTQDFEKVEVLKAQLSMREANLVRAEVEYLDRKELVCSGSVSKEDFIDSETRFLFAKADRDNLEGQLKQAIAQVSGTCVDTHPLVETAKEDARRSWLNLQRTEVRSPTHGIIAQRSAQVGEAVNPDDPLLAVIPLDQIWVNANFKETDLRKVRIGQSAEVKADMYGREVRYKGTVVGIGGGTGAVFSVLPPQNATGNWIKIVQRVPVRIQLDPEQVKDFPLMLGLSMKVKIDVRDQSGPRIGEPKGTDKPLYETDIFQRQEAGIEPILREVVQENQVLMSNDWCKGEKIPCTSP